MAGWVPSRHRAKNNGRRRLQLRVHAAGLARRHDAHEAQETNSDVSPMSGSPLYYFVKFVGDVVLVHQVNSYSRNHGRTRCGIEFTRDYACAGYDEPVGRQVPVDEAPTCLWCMRALPR